MLLWIAQIKHFPSGARLEHCQHQTLDQITHITDAACPAAVSIDGKWLVLQCLSDEIGDHAPIVDLTVGAIGVKDAHDTGVKLKLPIVLHRQRFTQTLTLIIASTWTNRIDVPPVI